MKKNSIILGILLTSLIVLGGGYLNKTPIPEQRKTNENIELAIYLEDEQTNTIPSKESGYYFDREKSTCTNEAYINWDSVSWSPVVNNMSEYKTRCEIHFTRTYTEGILNGTDPVLKDELIPVTIEENGVVKKADLESEWYSYANKNWANSVILDDQYDTLNNQGSVNGATKNDGYVTLDGIDDYIDLGLENYEFSNGITLSIKFVLVSMSQNGNANLLGNWQNAGGGIYVRPDGELRVSFYINNSYKYAFTQLYLEAGIEYEIVAIAKNDRIAVYLNKTLIKEVEIEYEPVSSEMPMLIGANPQANDKHIDFANIEVSNIQIYNRAINENEVPIVSEGKVANNDGLLRYVDFTNKSYENNEIIPEEAIESYFVWIPKYRYQLWDLGNYDSLTAIDESKVHEIPVIFGDYNTNDEKNGECTTPMLSGASGNCGIGDYMTHPAFISIPSTGFWVGKFETGYDGATSVVEAQQNANDSSKVIIKPNVISWRGIQVANAFYSSYNYQRNLDSHMMKNTEWGAVAYLQHSAYGSATSVRLNNNSDYVTGYQANNEPTCGYTGTNEECNRYCNDGTCNTAYPNSVLTSTTGNISGIYDMSGGAWEYVMGILLDESGTPMSGKNSIYNSGFNGMFGCPTCDNDTSELTSLTGGYDFPDSKYYDTYVYATVREQYQRRILGDATGEMGPFAETTYLTMTRERSSWYENYAWFALFNNPWFKRGGFYNNGLYSGTFAFLNTYGHASSGDSFRIVLTPE